MGGQSSVHRKLGAQMAKVPEQWTRDNEAWRKPDDLVALAPYICEFIGTFMLVLTVGYCIISSNPLWGATAIAIVLMAMVYSFGSVSGGHFNPAVSISLWLLGKVPGGWRKIMIYSTVQIAAGIAAGITVNCLFAKEKDIDFGPSPAYGWFPAMIVEVIYTGMLCFVVANCAGSKRNNPQEDKNAFYGLAIGFVIVAAGYAGGSISGAALNPAVSFGLDLSFWSDGIFWCFAYSLWQVAGAVCAALITIIIRADEFDQDWNPEMEIPVWIKLLCEVIGTFILVLTVGLNLVTKSPATAWSAAAALMCMIYSLGDLSGGHFNPAVTLGILLSGKDKDYKSLIFYPAAQAGGAMGAGLIYATIHRLGEYKKATFAIGPIDPYDWSQVATAEFFFTFVLAYVVLTVACTSVNETSTKHLNHAALAIGACVTAGGFAIGNVSGGVLNPAVAVGIGVANMMSWGSSPLPGYYVVQYAMYEFAGGATAACVFFATHPNEYSSK